MYLCLVVKKGNYFRLVGMLFCIMLWMFSIGIASVHNHIVDDSQQTHHEQTDHCDHQHHHASDQDCGICFLIHHNNPVSLSYFAIGFALLYPATLPKLTTPYLLSLQQDYDLGVPSLRGPPLY
ncbi:DUF2946 family protein [Sphingobacterium sp. lm-10]|uniref:DUF2946 family protein n=1 Tax=Sphingobacterium sp. lm-10 TaxID=2944904 RepID=UPI0032E3B18B